MPAPKRTGVVTTNVRLGRALHRKLKGEARRALRSLNQEIESRLLLSLERPARPIPAEPQSATAA
jgi:predicted HicB family RNase H-like nuclease